MTYILRTHQLTKAYRGEEVVSEVSMNIRHGEIYGFLGPNGAGKTTIMKMMTNLVKPTGGEIEILGEKVHATSYELLKRIGSMIEYPIFYEKLTARKNLELHCEYMGYYDKKAIKETLELVNLVNIENKPVKDFSLGMKQRLGLARAIITKPEILILDEPVNGLDPGGMHELREIFIKLSRQYGLTLLISSHNLAEIEQIADTIGVIRKGKLIKEASMEEIRNTHANHLELVVRDYPKAAFVLENKLQVSNFRVKEDKGIIHIYDHHVSQNDVIQSMVQNQVEIASINYKKQPLEDYFLQLIEGDRSHAELN
ncbi:ABC transporter ATP-binding protein [Jeotgalibacillus terrae]|uniref:ABC transporter ATP-binding protein n=1 Tax=Jeotgalibacillus terrae TaxID=587735 RepID=A0ABW5ZKV6_9BACL|nr:ABC transporter ATP-binding protein [Jeotgalibacillus terrae]MBM7578558.1 ABC-2 type transport system ATP-binding protein [Jeotgalibacillus terrae]